MKLLLFFGTVIISLISASNNYISPDIFNNNLGNISPMHPDNQIRAKHLLAERIKFPSLTAVKDVADWSIFDGITFPDSKTSLPYIFFGFFYAFSNGCEDSPYEGSLIHLLYEELLSVYDTDPEDFNQVFSHLSGRYSSVLLARLFANFLVVNGALEDAIRFYQGLKPQRIVMKDDLLPHEFGPATIESLNRKPELFFSIFKERISVLGLKLFLATESISVNDILKQKYPLFGYAVVEFLESVEQSFLMPSLVKEKISELYYSLTDDHFFSTIGQMMIARDILGEIETGIKLVIDSFSVALSAMQAGKVSEFISFMVKTPDEDYRVASIPMKTLLLKYLLEHIREKECVKFIKLYPNVLFESLDLLLANYGSDSVDNFLKAAPSRALHQIIGFLAKSGSLRQIAYFANVSSNSQFGALFESFFEHSQHSNAEFCEIFRYFAAHSTRLNDSNFVKPVKIQPNRFVAVMEDETQATMCFDMLLKGLVDFDDYILSFLMSNDTFYEVFRRKLPTFLKFFAKMSLNAHLTPFELDRLMALGGFNHAAYCRENIRHYIMLPSFGEASLPALVLKKLHFFRVWEANSQREVQSLIEHDERSLEEIVSEEYSENEYFLRIITYYDEQTRHSIHKFLLICNNLNFKHGSPESEEIFDSSVDEMFVDEGVTFRDSMDLDL